MKHILKEHATHFAKRGVPPREIPNLLTEAVENGRIVGHQGGRPIYEVIYNGKPQRVAITISNNGFIVGANPRR